MPQKLLLLPGDGIGPEVMAEVKAVIQFMNEAGLASFETDEDLVGGVILRRARRAITDAGDGEGACRRRGALRRGRRTEMGQGRPTTSAPRRRCCGCARSSASSPISARRSVYPALADASSLKRELVEGLDILILRELTGGVYFGEPKEIRDLGNGQKRAIDTQVYDTFEIERIARVAFELARTRRNKVTSMEKNNVMKSGVLWKEVVSDVHSREYPDVDARAHARRRRRHAARARAEAVRRHRHRQSLRRHALRRGGDADRLARHAAVGLARRARSGHQEAQGASTSRCMARRPTSPARASRTRSR